MSHFDDTAGYFEDDEPVDAVIAAYEQGIQGVTAEPTGPAGQQIVVSANFRTVMPSLSPTRVVSDKARLGQLIQA